VARLLFITGTAPDVRGGSGTYVGISVLREALLELGHHVELLAPASKRGPVSLLNRVLFNLKARGAVRARLSGIDAVVGFDLDGFLVRTDRARHVASVKGIVAEEARFEKGVSRARLTIEASLERLHVRRADRILATSDYSASRLVAEYGVARERVSVVPEPIDLARWGRALAETPEAPKGGKSILCVAHLYPRKDVATLLAALTRLPSQTVLRVVGIGPELERLRLLARRLSLVPRVEFLGHLSFARLAYEYRRADVFCLPSRQEGFGIVFLEAMAAGLPIVAARAAAVPEVVSDGQCGILVPPGDAEGLATALERLLEDPDERRRLSESGRRRVERYDAPKVAAEFLRAIGAWPFAEREVESS
jgi:glycosyltransferase involved in cell wall biosynthesis